MVYLECCWILCVCVFLCVCANFSPKQTNLGYKNIAGLKRMLS